MAAVTLSLSLPCHSPDIFILAIDQIFDRWCAYSHFHKTSGESDLVTYSPSGALRPSHEVILSVICT